MLLWPGWGRSCSPGASTPSRWRSPTSGSTRRWRAGSTSRSTKVSCDWWRARHVTPCSPLIGAAMQRIIRAVELDQLSPVDDLVKHSSSAVDIRTVLMQVSRDWWTPGHNTHL